MALGSATFSTECCIDCVVQADNVTAIAASAMGLMLISLKFEEATGSAALQRQVLGRPAHSSSDQYLFARVIGGVASKDRTTPAEHGGIRKFRDAGACHKRNQAARGGRSCKVMVSVKFADIGSGSTDSTF